MFKPALRHAHRVVSSFLLDPLDVSRKLRGLPYFARNAWRYRRSGDAEFPLRWRDLWYTSHDRFAQAGSTGSHYFHLDLWAARRVLQHGTRLHIDVGSRLDGFVAHALVFCAVAYLDIRPVQSRIPGLSFCAGSITALPFAAESIDSLSCLHVIEHIGLGRYGDPIDPQGHAKAARELVRVLAPGGMLLIGTPVGRQRLCFDAHRVFAAEGIERAFAPLQLEEFALIPDRADGVIESATFAQAAACEYGCGLFRFTR